eukprot:545339_1
MSHILFNIKKIHIDMKQLCSMIWLAFINNQNIDRWAIIKLQKFCRLHIIEKDEILAIGALLLQYSTNDVLNAVPKIIKHIPWKEYIDDYIVTSLTKPKPEILLMKLNINEQDRVQNLLDIMVQYNNIINNQQKRESECVYDTSTVLKVCNLFEENLVELMDMSFDVQCGNIKHSEEIKKNYECKLKSDCNILKNNIERQKYVLLSRALNKADKYYTNLTSKDYATVELLDSIHIQLFHGKIHYQRTNSRQLQVIQDQGVELFKDTLMNEKFNLFCEAEEYDTEA